MPVFILKTYAKTLKFREPRIMLNPGWAGHDSREPFDFGEVARRAATDRLSAVLTLLDNNLTRTVFAASGRNTEGEAEQVG